MSSVDGTVYVTRISQRPIITLIMLSDVHDNSAYKYPRRGAEVSMAYRNLDVGWIMIFSCRAGPPVRYGGR